MKIKSSTLTSFEVINGLAGETENRNFGKAAHVGVFAVEV